MKISWSHVCGENTWGDFCVQDQSRFYRNIWLIPLELMQILIKLSIGIFSRSKRLNQKRHSGWNISLFFGSRPRISFILTESEDFLKAVQISSIVIYSIRCWNGFKWSRKSLNFHIFRSIQRKDIAPSVLRTPND